MKFAKRILMLVTLLASLIGCATPTRMPFHDDATSAVQSGNSIYLISATLRNTYKPNYQPELLIIYVEESIVKGTEDRINFTMDDKAIVSESDNPEKENNYLLRMELEPGSYKLMGLGCVKNVFPVGGSFFVPIHAELEVNEPGIYYLGHINATVRERKGDEFKAGSSIPLIDQAVVGASGGTFDVEIVDLWGKDGDLYRSKFKALENIEITKRVLPPFDREKAQKWWEDH